MNILRNKNEILDEVKEIEKMLDITLPDKYKQFLSEEIKDANNYEVRTNKGESIYFYNYKDIAERNETYAIKLDKPDYLLIGQDGDLGYFLNVKNNSDHIYSLDLGVPGSLDMNEEAKDIYKLIS